MTTAGLDVRLREAEERAHLAENLISAATVLNEAGIRPDAPECRPLFDEIVRLPDEQSMRQHLREAASAPSRGKTYTRAARELLADTGEARPDGSYPIKDAEDVENAVADFNRSDGSDEDKAHIIKRAKLVPGGTDALPEDWVDSTRVQESVKRLEALGIPTLDRGPLGPARLREAASAAELADRGIPILAEPPPAPRLAPSHALEQLGIPLLPEGPGSGPRHVALQESEAGQVLCRLA